MAKIIAVEAQAPPRMAQTSATPPARAPSPPSSVGIIMPMRRSDRSDSNASAGKRERASTSAALALAILAASSARAMKSIPVSASRDRARRSARENMATAADILELHLMLATAAKQGAPLMDLRRGSQK